MPLLQKLSPSTTRDVNLRVISADMIAAVAAVAAAAENVLLHEWDTRVHDLYR